MSKEGAPEASGVRMTIRVFYPNPVDSNSRNPMDRISEAYEVSYLWKMDPVYHELVFEDSRGIRHSIIGLAYHVEETALVEKKPTPLDRISKLVSLSNTRP